MRIIENGCLWCDNYAYENDEGLLVCCFKNKEECIKDYNEDKQ